jgi:hypothetical protein
VEERINKWQFVVSSNEIDNALWINQDARFALTNLKSGAALNYTNGFKDNGVFLVVISGTVKINDIVLGKRDGLGISETDNFTITANEDSELLAIEIPMN